MHCSGRKSRRRRLLARCAPSPSYCQPGSLAGCSSAARVAVVRHLPSPSDRSEAAEECRLPWARRRDRRDRPEPTPTPRPATRTPPHLLSHGQSPLAPGRGARENKWRRCEDRRRRARSRSPNLKKIRKLDRCERRGLQMPCPACCLSHDARICTSSMSNTSVPSVSPSPLLMRVWLNTVEYNLHAIAGDAAAFPALSAPILVERERSGAAGAGGAHSATLG